MSVAGLVTDGSLLLATPVAAAAGLLSFFSPCVLPLVPGYLTYVTGLSGADLEGEPSASRGRPATAPATDAAEATGADPADALPPPALVAVGASAAVVATAPRAAAGSGRPRLSPGLTDSSGEPSQDSSPASVRPASVEPAAGRASAGRSWLSMVATAARSGPRGLRRVGRVTIGTGLFVLGFTVVFVSYGAAFGGLGRWLTVHQVGIGQVLGAVTIVMGLLFAGAFSRLSFANREFRLHRLPAQGLLGAPLLGALFGLGWTPCLGPTLAVVQGLALQSATAGRGAFLSAVYCLGLGVPFLVVGLAFRRVAGALRVVRSHARLLTLAGGALLVAVGVLQVTGQWADLVATLRPYAPGFAETPL